MGASSPLRLVRRLRIDRVARLAVSLPDFLPRQDDTNAKVYAGIALELEQRGAVDIGIGSGIDGDDQPAAALEQLIDAEVFDVAAVGQIDERSFLIERVEHFQQQIEF